MTLFWTYDILTHKSLGDSYMYAADGGEALSDNLENSNDVTEIEKENT